MVTQLSFGFDEDDPHLGANLAEMSGHAMATVRPRMGLAAWTNELAGHHSSAPYLASIGDDMVPVTGGWDEKLMAACGRTGMAYPDDKRRDDVPEAIVMTGNIVRALGWMCLPALGHWFVDTVWRDIGTGARCLAYRPDVTVRHDRYPPDATYADAAPGFARDMAAYQKWRLHGMRDDIATVEALCMAG